jgi:hypothetical protein
MFGADGVAFVKLGLEVSDPENLFGLFGEGDVADRNRPTDTAHGVFDGLLELSKIAFKVTEDAYCHPVAQTNYAKNKVFGTDVIVAQPECFLTAVLDYISDAAGKIAFHKILSLIGAAGLCELNVCEATLVRSNQGSVPEQQKQDQALRWLGQTSERPVISDGCAMPINLRRVGAISASFPL